MLEVLEPGLLTTVQDAGRPDAVGWGVPRGGACDPWSLRVANVVVGNDPNAPALETTLTGPTLRAGASCVVGLAGADLRARVVETDTRLEPGSSLLMHEGQTLAFASPGEQSGIRAYLAIAGGLQVPRVLGSAGTCLVGGFGGLDGRRLVAGDVLATDVLAPALISGAVAAPRRWSSGPQPQLEATRRPLQVLPGPHIDRLGRRTLDRLLSAEYRVSPRADRQAIVLEGPLLPAAAARGAMLSAPMVWGAIQLPPDGRPICLLADHQSVGGYPVVAVVISADLPALGQLGPADPVRFRLVDVSQAEHALREQERAWRHGLARLAHIP